MPYGTPQSGESSPTFSLGVGGQDELTIVNVSLSFSATKTQEQAMGTQPEDIEDLFQHVVDHMATLPAFPGSGSGVELVLTAGKSYIASGYQEVTPTEA